MSIVRRCLALLLASIGFMALPARAETADVLVDADQFACLAERIRMVPADPQGVYVSIRTCRTTGPKIMRHLVPPPRRLDANGVESLLFLRAWETRCIRANRNQLARITAPAGSGRLRLNLKACGQ